MTLDEELALIRQNKAPAQPDIGNPISPAPAAPDPYADLEPAETGLRAPPTDDAGFADVFGAGWQSETVQTDAWNYKAAGQRALADEMLRRFPIDVRQRILDPLARSPETEWDSLPELVTAEAARLASTSPEAAADWAGYPLSIEAFNQQIDAARKREIDEANAILDQPGGGFAEFLGRSARAVTDQTSLMLLPFGISGSALRTIAGEAVLGAAGEAAVLPREFEVARELDLPEPDALQRIALGAAAGGLLSGALIGLGKTITWARARRAGVQAATPPGANPLAFEGDVDAAEAVLRGGPSVAQASGQQPPPGTLGDVLARTEGRALPGAETLPYNEGAVVRAIVGAESGGNATARNPNSSATGAGQFIASTWLDLIKRNRPDLVAGLTDNQVLALRNDPNISVEMTAIYARENVAKMEAAGVRGIGPGEIYLGHFMGPGGAIRALTSPLDTPITALMSPKEIAANSRIRFGGKTFADFTAGDLRRWAQHKMRDAYDPAALSDLPVYAPTSRGYTGTGQVRAGDEFTIDVQYEVVDLSSLTRASGDLQPRDRSRIASDAWIAETAARLDPAQLMPSPTADRGAPIVGPDNIIESGNGRFGAIERAYARHPDRAQAYRNQIEAAGFAIPEGVQRPILIARRTSELTPEQRKGLVIAAQDSGVATMTPTEMARVTSQALTPQTLGRIDLTKPLNDLGNGDFLRAFVDRLPRSLRNAYYDAGGLLNAAGFRQLREAIFARAWSDPDILARYTETDAGKLKGLIQALEQAAPAWSVLKADIEAGVVRPEMDISAHVLDAIRLIGAAVDLAKVNKSPVAKALEQLLDEVDLLEGRLAPLTVALVKSFWRGSKAAPAEDIASFLTRYAVDAGKAGKVGDMLSTATPRDVLVAINPKTFGSLPEDLGTARGFARPGQAAQQTAEDAAARAAADPGEGFDAGASAPDAIAAAAEIRAALEAPAPGKFQPDPDKAGFPDTRGQGLRFHGSTSEIAALSDQYVGSDKNFYGSGFYTSDAVAITDGYAKAKGAKNGAVYRVDEIGPINALDMEQPVPDWLISDYRQKNDTSGVVDDLFLYAVEEMETNGQTLNLREFYDLMRDLSPEMGMATYDVQEYFDAVSRLIQARGYNALDHIGGLRTKKAPHQVRIYLTPESTLRIQKIDPRNPLGQPTPAPAPAAPSATAPAPAAAVVQSEIDALRGQFDDFEIDMPDGTTVTLRDVLDDLDADNQFDAFVQACAITPTGAAL